MLNANYYANKINGAPVMPAPVQTAKRHLCEYAAAENRAAENRAAVDRRCVRAYRADNPPAILFNSAARVEMYHIVDRARRRADIVKFAVFDIDRAANIAFTTIRDKYAPAAPAAPTAPAYNPAPVDRAHIVPITDIERARAARICAPFGDIAAKIDFSIMPFITTKYATKTGAARKYIYFNDNSAGGMVINAVMICRAANRQKMRGLSQGKTPAARKTDRDNPANLSATIPYKMIIRDRIFSAVFADLCAVYIAGGNMPAAIDRAFAKCKIDDNEPAEMLTETLTALYSAPAVEMPADFIGAPPAIDRETIRAAKRAVNAYLASETKTANNRYTAAVDDTATAAAVELKSFREWARDNAAERDNPEIQRTIRAAVCDIFRDMRGIERAAVYAYGIFKDFTAYNNGAGGKSAGGYRAIADYLNNEMTAAARVKLYNSDVDTIKSTKSRARARSEYSFTFAGIQRAIEKFRAEFSARYPAIVEMITAPAPAADITARLIGIAYNNGAPVDMPAPARRAAYKNDIYNLFSEWYV